MIRNRKLPLTIPTDPVITETTTSITELTLADMALLDGIIFDLNIYIFKIISLIFHLSDKFLNKSQPVNVIY